MIVFTKNEDGEACLTECEMDKIYDLCDELTGSETFQRFEKAVKDELKKVQGMQDMYVKISENKNLSDEEHEEAAEKYMALLRTTSDLTELNNFSIFLVEKKETKQNGHQRIQPGQKPQL